MKFDDDAQRYLLLGALLLAFALATLISGGCGDNARSAPDAPAITIMADDASVDADARRPIGTNDGCCALATPVDTRQCIYDGLPDNVCETLVCQRNGVVSACRRSDAGIDAP